jgi:hypothetical protein
MSSSIPDREGVWRIDYDEPCAWESGIGYTSSRPVTIELDVYALDPCDGILCIWSDDIGGCLSGPSDVWDTDEWLGHIPVESAVSHLHNAKFTFLNAFGA